MFEILVSVTVLIAVVMLIRKLTKGRVSMEMRYELWILVALRLAVPVSFGDNPYSAASAMQRMADVLAQDEVSGQTGVAGAEDIGMMAASEPGGDTGMAEKEGAVMALQNGIAGSDEEQQPGAAKADVDVVEYKAGVTHGLLTVWALGMICIGGYMLAGQIRLALCLRRMRQTVPMHRLPGEWALRLGARKMRVYQVEGLPVPCLAGRNIYLAPQMLEEDSRLSHVLAHEYAHALQGDFLWALVRGVLCMVYWFFPPVWMAAYSAKQDSELACDEKAVRILGERERYAYGRTLLEFVSGARRQPGYGALLSMDGSGRRVKERVVMIAGKRKESKAVAALVILTAGLACGCTFTGAGPKDGAAGAGIDMEESGKDMAADTGQKQDVQDAIKQNPKDIEEMEREETETIRKRLDAIEDEWAQVTAPAFEEIVYTMGDDTLDSAQKVELAAYFDYLYEGAVCPLQDGTWYLLGEDEESDISFYGLYTKQFGLRGMKVKAGGDVNTFDIPWMPSYRDVCVEVLEWAEDGAPRTFAFQNLVRNDGTHEIWQLYLADRYDTGTVDLYCFEPEDYMRQFQDMVELRVNREAQTVELVCGEDVVGSIDISRYSEYTVEGAVWEAAAVSFLPNTFTGGQDYEPVAMMTGIGLKVAQTEVVQYGGLTNIVCPIDIGAWGERRFTLEEPYVDVNSFHGGI